MITKTLDWVRAHQEPLFKWGGGFLAVATLAINTCTVVQNSRTLRLTLDGLYLSTPPSLSVEVLGDRLVLSNAGIYPLHDIRASLVLYKVGPEPPFVRARSIAAGDHRVAERLAPGKNLEIPKERVLIGDFAPLQHFEGRPLRAVVLTFRRHLDHRKFMTLEVFHEDHEALLPLYQHDMFGTSGPWPSYLSALSEIESKERMLFRISGEIGQ